MRVTEPCRYDFDLRTGHSEISGLKACTYTISIKQDEGGDVVYVEAPTGGTNWRIVELRPVSEGVYSTVVECNEG